MSFINGFRHFATITKHRHKVISHCRRAGIFWQGLRHDLSKYSPTEFLMGAKYYIGTRSPNDGERADKGYSSAWMHHKGRNKHHFEYWTDYNPETRIMSPVKMPINYVKEMFCDRVAASKIYKKENYDQKHPLEYFIRGKAKRNVNQETSDLLESWLRMLAEEGEEKTLKFIKNQKLY